MLKIHVFVAGLAGLVLTASPVRAERTYNILLTGYWPPTNDMIRLFSNKPELNPDGWQGQNWEGRGYNIYSYFPEFVPPDCVNCGQGMGDLEVDYQDTSQDWWPIANGVGPVAIITFSRGGSNSIWEIETNQYNRPTWINDYTAPLQPTPAPPDDSVPANFLRPSTLPQEEILLAIQQSGLPIGTFICQNGDGGGFLSEFIAYHGVWYQAIHDDPADEAECVAAGHIHVGRFVPIPVGTEATFVSLRVLIDHVNGIVGIPGDDDGDEDVDLFDFEAFEGCVTGPDGERTSECDVFDFDSDGDVDRYDARVFQLLYTG